MLLFYVLFLFMCLDNFFCFFFIYCFYLCVCLCNCICYVCEHILGEARKELWSPWNSLEAVVSPFFCFWKKKKLPKLIAEILFVQLFFELKTISMKPNWRVLIFYWWAIMIQVGLARLGRDLVVRALFVWGLQFGCPETTDIQGVQQFQP